MKASLILIHSLLTLSRVTSWIMMSELFSFSAGYSEESPSRVGLGARWRGAAELEEQEEHGVHGGDVDGDPADGEHHGPHLSAQDHGRHRAGWLHHSEGDPRIHQSVLSARGPFAVERAGQVYAREVSLRRRFRQTLASTHAVFSRCVFFFCLFVFINITWNNLFTKDHINAQLHIWSTKEHINWELLKTHDKDWNSRFVFLSED